jgi:hypothetical protein
MNNKKLVFAIVGWNQVEYIRNAIDSVLLNGGEDSNIYVSLTGGNQADHKIIEKEYGAIRRVFIDIIEHNGANAKVGSLYKAYNKLMEKCKSAGYEYLNLIQCDFQLLWWSEKVFEHYLEIFEAFPNAIQINTGFFRCGSHPDIYTGGRLRYRVLPNSKTIPFQHGSGISDWGLVNLKRFFA